METPHATWAVRDRVKRREEGLPVRRGFADEERDCRREGGVPMRRGFADEKRGCSGH